MRNRVALVFLVGMLAGALMFAGGFVVATSMADDAKAQTVDPGNWHLEYFEDDNTIEGLERWLGQMPSSCDVVPTTQANLFLYRCPES